MFFYWECSQRRFRAASRKLSALLSVPPQQKLFSLSKEIKSRFCKFTYLFLLFVMEIRQRPRCFLSTATTYGSWAKNPVRAGFQGKRLSLDVLCCLERDLHREWNSCYFSLSEHFHSVWWKLCLPAFLWCWLEFNCLFSDWFPMETCRTAAPDGFPPILPSLANNV